MAGIGVFVIREDALFEDLNAPTPPESRRHWWKDQMARSVLRSALKHHRDKLVAEAASRREGRNARIPGLVGRCAEEVKEAEKGDNSCQCQVQGYVYNTYMYTYIYIYYMTAFKPSFVR